MKRRLLNFYRHQVPDAVKRAIPDSVSAHVAGSMYRLYPHPDLAFYHARYLSRTGQGLKAAKLYEPSSGNNLIDPLFECESVATYPDQNARAGAEQFYVEFSYTGIKVFGSLKEGPEPKAEQVDIYLDDQLLRSEKLTYHKGAASFHFSIKRSTITRFNPSSVLSLRTPDGRHLVSDGVGTHVTLIIPHGDSSISDLLDITGTLDKKGNLRPIKTDIVARHQAYLSLYQRANQFFKQDLNRPLIIVCGTLLGQHRDGDFIPGDDDFDVGYVSEKTTPDDVKVEAIQMIERMVSYGFTVLVNRAGKPFRISDDKSGLGVHLDVTPIFTCGDNHVWMHKLARLKMDINDMRQTTTGVLGGIDVDKPIGAEAYLSANYGLNWHTPDPNFTYADWTVPIDVVDGLRATCLSQSEQRSLMKKLNGGDRQGSFIPIGLQPLYPVEPKDLKATE